MSLKKESDALRQQINDFRAGRNAFASSIPMESFDTWRNQLKTNIWKQFGKI